MSLLDPFEEAGNAKPEEKSVMEIYQEKGTDFDIFLMNAAWLAVLPSPPIVFIDSVENGETS